jgi:hypothetical protein
MRRIPYNLPALAFSPKFPRHKTLWKKMGSKIKIGPDCWSWGGVISKEGYALLYVRRNIQGKPQPALVYRVHRILYELLNGPIPDGLVPDHLCRNRACPNPDHLELVTVKENILRGVGVTAVNAKKLCCPYGHPYDAIVRRSNGATFRRCTICANAQWRAYAKRRAQKAK